MDPAEADVRREQERPKAALNVGKLSDLSSADLGASKVVAVATDPASASLEPVPRQDAPHVHDETCPVDCKRDVAAPGAGGPEHRSYV